MPWGRTLIVLRREPIAAGVGKQIRLARVPSASDVFDKDDVFAPGSRFSPRPAIALGVAEEEWPKGPDAERGAEETLRRRVGEWAFEEQAELGRAEAVNGTIGRGASGWAPVLEFVGLHAAGGVISVAAGMAFKQVWKRARRGAAGTEEQRVYVSRGAAAYLAAAEVATRFGQQSAVEIEAVEEPSSIAGSDLLELSYVGAEPWVVLLRDRDAKTRYIVVVAANGDVLGSMKTAMGEFEGMFLPPAEDSEWVQPPRRRR
jgi:hypothetical protein